MPSMPSFTPPLPSRHQTDSPHLVPLYLPPSPIRVINTIQTGDLRSLFNTENTFISKDGGGAGNKTKAALRRGRARRRTAERSPLTRRGGGAAWR